MPIYEYNCSTCGRTFEEIFYTNEPIDIKPCSCGSNNVKKLPSIFRPKMFNPLRFVEDISDKPMPARNRQELQDSINRYNDGEEASKTGKLRVYE